MTAHLQTEIISIDHDNTNLHAFIAHPAKLSDQAPAILIFHPCSGRDDFCDQKALTMAAKGYIGIAIDLFGEGKVGRNIEENQNLIAPFIKDRAFLKERLTTILNNLKTLQLTEKSQFVGIGYCFGGLCVLDAVRNNLGLKGGVSVHGLLGQPDYPLPSQYGSKVLALHGYQDPMVSPAAVKAFQDEMLNARVDLQFMSYSLGVHAFTNPEANDTQLGTVYNPLLDYRSTEMINNFLSEVVPLV